MDVRCEKCQTEYELDETKLKPGGVTVKCTSCGHMFKIRKRSPTNVGIPTGNHPSQRQPRAASSSGPPPVMQASPADSMSGAQPKRKWLIQLENGEAKSCRELATLQQWIVAGLVTRNSRISRTGKTWKPLGEIAELSKFFAVADEARQVRADRTSSPPLAVPPAPQPRTSAPAAATPYAPAALIPAAAPGSPTMLAGPPPGQARARVASQLPLQPPPSAAYEPAMSPPVVAKVPKLADPSERATGGWAVDAKLARQLEDEGTSGPVGGLAKGIPTDDVQFAGGKIAPLRTGFADSFAPTYDDDDEMFDRSRRGGAGKWIVIGSLVVIAAAVGLVYMFVFRDTGEPKAANTPSNEQTATADAGPVAGSGVVIKTPDGGVAAVTDDGVLAGVSALVYGDVDAMLEPLVAKLAEIEGGDKDLAVLVARARVHAALAQHRTDAASDATKTAAKQIRKEVTAEVGKGLDAANKAIKLDKSDVAANVVMADLLRLQGKPQRQIDRYLKAHLKASAYEARYVQAMILLRDKRAKQAIEALVTVKAQAEAADVRPSYQLARIAFGEKDYDTARAEVQHVLAAQPEHAGALALLDRIAAATEVATSDPMPPEDRGGGGGSDSYDKLVAKADKEAEEGRCGTAIKLYKTAINKNPSGVEALTGLGYCYIETQQFASAHSQFSIALGISPRYVPALWGVAEAYQQQGRSDLAIKAYKHYLELHPTGGRVEAAKRQIEKLGGKADPIVVEPPPDDPPDDPKPDTTPTDPKPDTKPPTDPKPDTKPPADPPAPAPAPAPVPAGGE